MILFGPASSETETRTLLDVMLAYYGAEGVTMPKTLEEFRQYYLREHVHELPPEELLKHVPLEERLKGLSAEEIRAYLQRLENGATPPPPTQDA